MNFDGTFPEKDELLRGKPEQSHPPVRMVVSYPQSEEGKRKSYWVIYVKWIIALAAITIVCGGCSILYRYLKEGRSVIEYDFQIERPSDVYLGESIKQVIKRHYENKLFENDKDKILNEIHADVERFEDSELNEILFNLGPDFNLGNIQDDYVREELRGFILGEVHHAEEYLKFYLKQKELLLSYQYQIDQREYKEMWNEPVLFTVKQINELRTLRDDCMKPLEAEISGESVIFFRRIAIFSDIIKTLNAMTQNIRQVIIVASTIYMDSNLTKDIDLAIIAPDWRIPVDMITIDLSGKDAALESGSEMEGRHGGNGGSMLGVGKWDRNQITVISNGGNGGPGQDGQDGSNGTENLKPVMSGINNLCTLPMEPVQSNPFGELLQLTKVFHNETCGTRGVKGGPGGLPGKGGIIIMVNNNETSSFEGTKGLRGANGKDGKDGVSAPGTCHYLAYSIRKYFNEELLYEKWSQSTVVKCKGNETLPLIDNEMMPSSSPPKEENVVALKTKFFNDAISAFTWKARKRLMVEHDPQMFQLLENIESDSIYMNLTTTASLLNEMKKLIKFFDNEMIYSSFLRKIRLQESQWRNPESKGAIQFIRAVIWSKLSAIRFGFGDFYVVNLEKYIELVLDNISKLDIDNFNISNRTISTVVADVKEKLAETQRVIENVTIPHLRDLQLRRTDDRLLSITEMSAKAISVLVDITKDFLTYGNNYDSKHKRTLQELLQKHSNNKEAYYTIARKQIELDSHDEVNRELLWACAEMFISADVCTNTTKVLQTWKKFKLMDSRIVSSLEIVSNGVGTNLSIIADSLQVIRGQLRADLASNAQISSSVQIICDTANELTLLVLRCRHPIEEQQLRTTLSLLDNKLSFTNEEVYDAVTALKKEILKNILYNQYRSVYYAYWQWAYPYNDPVHTITEDLDKNGIILEINRIKSDVVQSQTTIQKRDSNIREADFQINAAVGPFYSWKNDENRQTFTRLLEGRKVRLTSYIHNSAHVANKDAIKFRMIKMVFTGPIQKYLNDFAMELCHSGYSHYLHHGASHVEIGREICLYYSFAASTNRTPDVYNNVFKKLLNGDLMLSPYTSWTVQLQTLTKKGRFEDLRKFANSTDVHLVGRGWYTIN